MSSIMDRIGPEHPELHVFALELGKIAELDFVYTLSCTNINHSVPNLVRMNTIIRCQMSSIMDLIGVRKIAIFYFFHNQASANIDQSAPNSVTIYMTNRSRDKFNYGYNRIRTFGDICP